MSNNITANKSAKKEFAQKKTKKKQKSTQEIAITVIKKLQIVIKKKQKSIMKKQRKTARVSTKLLLKPF